MPTTMNTVIQYIRRIAAACEPGDAPDRDLLARFAQGRDEEAFAALMRRHGPMVLSVCARVLSQAQDAEDAFQATFLVLARKAGSLERPALLANWLYGVAYRISLKARTEAAHCRAKETTVSDVAAMEPASECAWTDVRCVLDDEIARLPEKYRVPFVLCHLEGKTNDEAAALLGRPKGTILSRLAVARERLRCRLTRRGVTLSAAALATILSGASAEAVAPVRQIATRKAAMMVAAGQSVAGVVSARVASLMEGALRAMWFTKLKTTTAVLFVLGALAATGLAYQALDAENPGDTPRLLAQVTTKAKTDSDKLQGTWRIVDMVTNGKPNTKNSPAEEADVVFTGDKMTLAAQPSGKTFLEFTIKLNSSEKPRAIDLTKVTEGVGRGKTALGIYELDSDTLKVCFTQDEDRARPTEFKSADGARHVLLTMRRQKSKK